MTTRAALRWIGMAAGLLVFAWLLSRLAPQREVLAQAWRQLKAQDLLLSFGGFLAAQLAFAFSWHRLLHAAGETGHFAGDAARWGVSLAGKYFPGKVWQAIARFGLYHGAPRGSRVAPAYAREMMLSTSAALAAVGFGTLAAGLAHARALVLPSLAGALLLLVLAAPGPGLRVLAWVGRWLPWKLEIGEARWRPWLLAWGLQLAGYLCLGLGFYALGRGLGGFAAGQADLAVASLCLGGLAGIAAFFVPAGIGVREAALAWFLAPVVGAGPALVLAVAARAWISMGEAALVVAGLAWLQRPAARQGASA